MFFYKIRWNYSELRVVAAVFLMFFLLSSPFVKSLQEKRHFFEFFPHVTSSKANELKSKNDLRCMILNLQPKNLVVA